MPPAKKTASRRRAPARKPAAAKEPAALRRLNKSLEGAQDALAALRNDVSRDVGAGARGLYKDVQRFVKDARRDSRKLGTALQRDVERAQKRLAPKPRSKASARKSTARRAPAPRTASGARRKASGGSTTRRAASSAGGRSRRS
jgi:hypothetical protein